MLPGVTPAHKRLSLSGLSSKYSSKNIIYIYHSRHTHVLKKIGLQLYPRKALLFLAPNVSSNMTIMIRISLLLVLFFLLASCEAQTKNSSVSGSPIVTRQSADSDSLLTLLDSCNVSYQFRGNCYAYSSEKYSKTSNGEAHSLNLAHRTDSSFSKDSIYLYLNFNELTTYSKGYLGHKLYLVNNSNKPVNFSGQDSRLNIVAEAMDKSGNWRPISYLPSSWCGNSYHSITLGGNEYWEFKIPVFTGNYKTKLRYVLSGEKDIPSLVSNEIEVLINKNQFDTETKEGHNPNGLMDPYND
jgi:hypothetical protein